MKGRAPNCSATGSQVLPVRKLKPNFARDGPECIQSSYTSRTVTKNTLAAKISVTRWVIWSPPRQLFTSFRGRDWGGAVTAAVPMQDLLLYQSELLLFLVYYRLGERRVAEPLSIRLAGGH